MKLIYCILAYDEPKLLHRTVEKLRGEDTFFIIHVQKNVDITPFLIDGDDVFFVPENERIETIWGDITCVKASLLLFSKAMAITQKGGKGYCILMSGTDYPVKSNAYIKQYFSEHWPADFYSSCWYDDFYDVVPVRKAAIQNCYDYWISYPGTKIKIWIRPRRFILPRCIRNQKIIKNIPQIILSVPTILKYFFFGKRYNPYVDLFDGEKFYTGETWMELSFPSVQYLLNYKNDVLFKRAESMHNPEEFMFSNILRTRSGNFINMGKLCSTVHIERKGSMELDDGDKEYILSLIADPNILYSRKFHDNTCQELFSIINDYTSKPNM